MSTEPSTTQTDAPTSTKPKRKRYREELIDTDMSRAPDYPRMASCILGATRRSGTRLIYLYVVWKYGTQSFTLPGLYASLKKDVVIPTAYSVSAKHPATYTFRHSVRGAFSNFVSPIRKKFMFGVPNNEVWLDPCWGVERLQEPEGQGPDRVESVYVLKQEMVDAVMNNDLYQEFIEALFDPNRRGEVWPPSWIEDEVAYLTPKAAHNDHVGSNGNGSNPETQPVPEIKDLPEDVVIDEAPLTINPESIEGHDGMWEEQMPREGTRWQAPSSRIVEDAFDDGHFVVLRNPEGQIGYWVPVPQAHLTVT